MGKLQVSAEGTLTQRQTSAVAAKQLIEINKVQALPAT
jgi:hypothetical protein